MDFDITNGILLFIGGLMAGFFNTYSGNGSVFTLSLLLFMNMPASIANGTNRLGIIMQSLISSYHFSQKKIIKISNYKSQLIICTSAAIIGAYSSSQIGAKNFEKFILLMMLFILYILFFPPNKKINHWLKTHKKFHYLIYFIIGFYGGFIQMGVGILFIVLLSAFEKLSMVQINVLKVYTILIYTLPVLFIFILREQIAWRAGLILVAGQGISSYLASKYIIDNKNFNMWLRRLLIFMVMLTIVKLSYSIFI